MNKIKTRTELRQIPGGEAVIDWLMKNNPNLLNTYLPLKCVHLTKEECKLSSLKFKTRKEWKEKDPFAYSKSIKNKWINELTIHMLNLKGFLTKEYCINEAKKYSSRGDWIAGHGSSYTIAGRNGWRDECCAHMSKAKNKKIKELRQLFTEKELFENGILKCRKIKDISE